MSSDRTDAPVRFDAVTKRFPGPGRAAVARQAAPWGSPVQGGTTALDDVTFSAAAGEVLGIIGRNGAGKSTLLKLAAGVAAPTAGAVRVDGTPAAMIELGMSFHPDLSGWENLPVAAALLGITPDLLDAVVDDVVEFSGLRPFLDLPVKHFSTGMVARLGFALATHVPTRVLLVDEVLAVGDRAFQARCIDRVRSLAHAGTAILFVSHSLDLVCQVCDRVLCLEAGRLVDDGPALEVVGRYAGAAARPRIVGDPPARLTALALDRGTIHTGEHLRAAVTVDVLEPDRHLVLRTDLVVPPQRSGTRGTDLLDATALRRTGVWDLSADIGPIPTTAGRLELILSLVDAPPGGPERLVDQRSTLFDVVGEDVGVVRVAVDGGWDVVAAAELPERGATPTAPVDGALVTARHLGKEFGSSRWRRRSGPATGRTGALRDIGFEIAPGESVGLIGANGAGKSTLLRILAGVSHPTEGSVDVRAEVAAVLELGAGFHGDLTGEENLEFTWRLNGGTVDRWPATRESIVEFAGLADAMALPVKHYSTGMRARLALAIALELRAGILLIDEALSVGDLEFRERVRARLLDDVDGGTSLLFASHDLHLLGSICERVIRLDEGRLVDDGPTADVLAEAGGTGWSGGERVTEGGVLVRGLRVDLLDQEWHGPFEVEFDLDIVRPDPDVYVEFSIRLHLDPAERQLPRDDLAISSATLCLQRLDALRDVVTTPGRHHVVGHIDGLPVTNLHDVVVTVIEGIDGSVLSEQWVPVVFGGRGESYVKIDVVWSVEAVR